MHLEDTAGRFFSKRDTNICKGIAILMMLFHHLFYSKTTPGIENVTFWLLSQSQVISIARAAKVCVAIFVFLTAYGTTISFQKSKAQNWFEYSKHRYLTLMAGFWLIFINSQVISYLTTVRTREFIYGDNFLLRCFYTLIDGLGLADAFGTPTYNPTWWYMTYAILLIFMLPALISLTERIKLGIIPLVIILPRLAELDVTATFWRYMLPLTIGILASQNRWFERIDAFLRNRTILRIILFPFLVILVLGSVWVIRRWGFSSVMETPAVCGICLIAYLYLAKIPGSGILELLGKHSMNIFLTHTFIKGYFCNELVYSFHYPELIFIALLVLSLAVSYALNIERKGLEIIRKHFAQRLRNQNNQEIE